jgi:hypothetical protein
MVPSPRLRKSLASSMRRSSIGLPLRPSTSPPDFRGNVPFDDEDGILDEDDDPEEPESSSGPSKQPQTPRRVGTSSVFQNGADSSRPRPQITQGLQDVEMQQVDEDEEVTPKKPAEKRPRKKRVLAEIPRKNPFVNATTTMLISFQHHRKIHLGFEEANDYVTSHLNGGDARKLSTEDVIRARKLTSQQSKKLSVSRKMNPSHWVLLHTRPNAPPPIAERQPKNQE